MIIFHVYAAALLASLAAFLALLAAAFVPTRYFRQCSMRMCWLTLYLSAGHLRTPSVEEEIVDEEELRRSPLR